MRRAIDQERTGKKLKMMLTLAGYDVKFVQEYLQLECPQSIYRWFKGKILPSVDNLCSLSILLGVHIEELLVLQGQPMLCGVEKVVKEPRMKRLLLYATQIQKVA